MSKKIESARRIDKARYDQVMWSRVCPGCGNYVIHNVHRRSKKDALDARGSKYLGSFHACGRPEGHECWHMSSYDERKPDRQLYETFGQMAKYRGSKT